MLFRNERSETIQMYTCVVLHAPTIPKDKPICHPKIDRWVPRSSSLFRLSGEVCKCRLPSLLRFQYPAPCEKPHGTGHVQRFWQLLVPDGCNPGEGRPKS